jgi:hypothetical protein
MEFTGSNLRRVRTGLVCALGEVRNMLATCPDPGEPEFSDSYAAYLREEEEYATLLKRVNAAIAKETKGI